MFKFPERWFKHAKIFKIMDVTMQITESLVLIIEPVIPNKSLLKKCNVLFHEDFKLTFFKP